MLDRELKVAIEQMLAQRTGDATPIRETNPVHGGDINVGARITTGKDSYFVKWNAAPHPGMFGAEARGLDLLARAGELRVPQVIGFCEDSQQHAAFLVMEWVGRGGNKHEPATSEALGRGLAKLHHNRRPTFGWDQNNYIGSLPQQNPDSDDWIDFYRAQRLQFQLLLAVSRGRMPPRRRHKLERLMAKLDNWIPAEGIQPSLLHGDLWGGNYMVDPAGNPVLIDPAVYYGHREVEMAFTELFGGFSPRFYAAYNEVWPLPTEYADRRKLYQLYPLLVHLNLFGESYGSSVDSVLAAYVG